MMKQYIIVGGVNGVGKTSFIGVFKELLPNIGEIIDPDRITLEMGGDAFAGCKTALKRIRKCIDNRFDFLQETTLSGHKTEATAKEVKELGYHTHLIYIGLDTVEESLRRIKNRVCRGGHDIPRNDVIRRFQNRWEAVARVLPYCDEAEFYDNNNGFVKVAEYRNGEFCRIGSNTCSWVDELGAYLREH